MCFGREMDCLYTQREDGLKRNCKQTLKKSVSGWWLSTGRWLHVLEGTNCCITSFQLYFKSINNNPSLPACVGILSTNYCANWLAVITFPPFSLLPLSAESSGLGACLSRLLVLLNIQSGCRVATPPHEYSTAGGHEAYRTIESQKC